VRTCWRLIINCEHFSNGVCLVATKLANKDVLPILSQCEYCTQKATPSQDVNKVTVSLALSVNPDNREDILKHYRYLLADGGLLRRQQEHWEMIHTVVMSELLFALWRKSIPNECKCGDSFDLLVKDLHIN
jgi:hypothetical protein